MRPVAAGRDRARGPPGGGGLGCYASWGGGGNTLATCCKWPWKEKVGSRADCDLQVASGLGKKKSGTPAVDGWRSDGPGPKV
jgi:hypothetical protein